VRKDTNMSVNIVIFLAEIQTQHLSNTSLDHQHYTAAAINGPSTQQFLLSSSDVTATTCFGYTTIIKLHTVVYYCSDCNRNLRLYTTVCNLMMAVWPKHVMAVTSEEERRNCCIDGPLVAELIYTRNRKHTTVTTIRDYHGKHNSWLHIQLIAILLRSTNFALPNFNFSIQ
jgi:hypothetical protein